MHFVMINYINTFLTEKSEVSNGEVITLALVGILFGLALGELADAIRSRRSTKEVAR